MTERRYRPGSHPAAAAPSPPEAAAPGPDARAALQGRGGDPGDHGDRPLETLRNLGPRTADWLRGADIPDTATLRRMGAAAAYVRVKRTYPREVTRTLLWALAGALADRPYTRLPPALKAGLVAQVRGLPLPAELPADLANDTASIATVIAGSRGAAVSLDEGAP